MGETAWPEWRLEKLRELWRDGKSAAQIATILGGGLTRNAVVGKAHRMGLAGRPSPIKREAGVPTPRRMARRAYRPSEGGRQELLEARERSEQALNARADGRPTNPIGARTVAPPPPQPASVPQRVSCRTCCWPIGDPREPGFHFCEATPVLEGRSYCDDHHAKAFQKRAPHVSASTPLFEQTRKWAS